MAYTDRYYSDQFTPKKRSDRGDLLKDAEDAFYGGGQAQPRPTPTPTPKPVSLAKAIPDYVIEDIDNPLRNTVFGSGAASFNKTLNYADKSGTVNSRGFTQVQLPSGGYAAFQSGIKPSGSTNGSQNAASRVNQSQIPTGGSRFIGNGGVDLGPIYNDQGGVNPLPRGAVGSQGNPVLNRSLNGAQPPAQTAGAAGRMTHTEMATDIARRNLTAQGAGQALTVPQPTLTGYQWHQATGGLSGGNNAYARYNWSDQSVTQEPAGSQYATPRLGLPRSQQPAIGALPTDTSQTPAPAQYPTAPGGNINFNVPGGSMQDALQKIAPPGTDYSASTGQYIPSSTPGLASTVRGQAPQPIKKPDEVGYGSAYGY